MIVALLDTDILIDFLRNYAPAVRWAQQLPSRDLFGITAYNYMEVIDGSEDTPHLRDALRLLRRFILIRPTDDDILWALREKTDKHLRNKGIGEIDYQIAAVILRLSIPFYTRNLKHFTPLPGALAVQPY